MHCSQEWHALHYKMADHRLFLCPNVHDRIVLRDSHCNDVCGTLWNCRVVYLLNMETNVPPELWEHVHREQFNKFFHQTVNCCATRLALFSINMPFSDVPNELMEYDSTLLRVRTVCGKLQAPKSSPFQRAPLSNLRKFHKIFQSAVKITDVTCRADLLPLAL